MNKKILLACALGLALAGTSAGAVWWMTQQGVLPGTTSAAAPRAPRLDATQYRYITLDKIIVMLKPDAAEAGTRFLAMDLVLRSDKSLEPAVKSDLPLLRSVVVRTLSRYSSKEASGSDLDALAAAINKDLVAVYESEGLVRPFSEAMIARFIIE